MTWDEVDLYQMDLIYNRMSHLLTDLLYFDVDKDTLKIVFQQYSKNQGISSQRISLLLQKIENFGEENIHEWEITESTNQDNLSNKDWDAKIMRIGMGKWLTSIEKIGTSIIGGVKGMVTKDEQIEEENKLAEEGKQEEAKATSDKDAAEEKSEHQTESTAGMSALDAEDEVNFNPEMEFDKLEDIEKKEVHSDSSAEKKLESDSEAV